MRILYFKLNGCGTEKYAMATKFFTFFACLQLFRLYANFHLILTNNNFSAQMLTLLTLSLTSNLTNDFGTAKPSGQVEYNENLRRTGKRYHTLSSTHNDPNSDHTSNDMNTLATSCKTAIMEAIESSLFVRNKQLSHYRDGSTWHKTHI